MNRLIIVGAGGHGKVIADIAVNCGYEDIVFLDDDKLVTECAGFPVVGTIKKINMLDGDKIVAIGNPTIRELLLRGIDAVTLIHPQAVIGRRVKIGKGTVVMAGAIVNSDTSIGDGCIINTASSVDHDCVIEDYSHIAVGAHVCGSVHIGKRNWVGAGAIVINNIQICDSCLIGAGAVVIKNIVVPGTYIGVPASNKNGEENSESFSNIE